MDLADIGKLEQSVLRLSAGALQYFKFFSYLWTLQLRGICLTFLISGYEMTSMSR